MEIFGDSLEPFGDLEQDLGSSIQVLLNGLALERFCGDVNRMRGTEKGSRLGSDLPQYKDLAQYHVVYVYLYI